MNILEVTDKEIFLKTLPLLNQLMSEEGEQPVTVEQGWEGFQKASTTGYKQFYTEAEGDITSVIGLRSFYDPLETNVGFEINNLIVKSELRGQGIGSKLFEFAVQKAKDNGASWIRLMVLNNNTKATKFYEKYNFEDIANLMLWRKDK